MLGLFGRLALAVVIAFAGMTVLKSRHRTALAWFLRLASSLAALAGALWIAIDAIPYTPNPQAATYEIVASAVVIAGLAAEELVGGDLRRVLGL